MKSKGSSKGSAGHLLLVQPCEADSPEPSTFARAEISNEKDFTRVLRQTHLLLDAFNFRSIIASYTKVSYQNTLFLRVRLECRLIVMDSRVFQFSIGVSKTGRVFTHSRSSLVLAGASHMNDI